MTRTRSSIRETKPQAPAHAAEIVREYGPFAGADQIHGVTHDGRRVWAATGSTLVAFDPEHVGCTPVERVADQPGGADRLVVRSTGVEHVWVNGVATRRAGEDVPGAAPGRLLRR